MPSFSNNIELPFSQRQTSPVSNIDQTPSGLIRHSGMVNDGGATHHLDHYDASNSYQGGSRENIHDCRHGIVISGRGRSTCGSSR